MQIVIPMSGRGARFADVGYKSIKPLIEVEGRPFIEHVIRLFPGATDFIFICAEDHLRTTPIEAVLKRLVPNAKIRGIDFSKVPGGALGPVPAVLHVADLIDDSKPVIVNYCDFSVHWDFAAFQSWIQQTNPDGAITAYRGFHPHSLGPNRYAYLKMQGDQVIQVQEKKAFTDNHFNEFASAGTYYFRTGEIVKRFFTEAIKQNLKVGKEFYASLPYNLMIEAGLSVTAYELEHFLQWGTPEDLEEYKQWSDWFRAPAGWKPTKKTRGALLIPMLGIGKRFQEAGYQASKPNIIVDGETMLSRVRRTLPPTESTLIVTRPELRDAVHSPDIALISEKATRGQVETCLLAEPQLQKNEPLLVSACDNVFKFDEAKLAILLADEKVDFVCWVFKNHAHANRNPQQYGWVKADDQGLISEVTCKQAVSTQPKNDLGVTGTFWFRKAGVFFEEAHRMLRAGTTVNGEFYVDVLAGNLAKRGLRGKIFLVDHFICLGTPDDVKTYEYWASYFKKQAADESKRGNRRAA